MTGNVKQVQKYVDEFEPASDKDITLLLDLLIKRLPTLGSDMILPVNRLLETKVQKQSPALFGEYSKKLQVVAEKVEASIYEIDYPRDVFVAYSSKDYQIVQDLVNELEIQGITCFVALRNLPHGAISDYQKALETAIDSCSHFLFVSTKNSRRRDCDAYTIEIPYASKQNIDMIEYIIDAHTTLALDKIIERYFKNSEWCYHIDDIINRIMALPEEEVAEAAPQKRVKYCASCGEENDENNKFCYECGAKEFVASIKEFAKLSKKKLAEEKERVLEQERKAKEEKERALEQERKAKEEAEKKLEAQRKEAEQMAKRAQEARAIPTSLNAKETPKVTQTPSASIDPNKKCDLMFVRTSGTPLAAIKVIQSVTGCGLMEAKKIVDNHFSIMRGSYEEVLNVQKTLEAAGIETKID